VNTDDESRLWPTGAKALLGPAAEEPQLLKHGPSLAA
jgi:hypothetical protein